MPTGANDAKPSKFKEQLLQEIWGQEMRNDPQPDQYRLKIGAHFQENKKDTLKILEEDVCQVIKLGETTGRRVMIRQEPLYLLSRVRYLTFWVEYRKEDGETCGTLDAYSHRMKIELERVWNGRKRKLIWSMINARHKWKS